MAFLLQETNALTASAVCDAEYREGRLGWLLWAVAAAGVAVLCVLV
jgi:hypothetical protein